MSAASSSSETAFFGPQPKFLHSFDNYKTQAYCISFSHSQKTSKIAVGAQSKVLVFETETGKLLKKITKTARTGYDFGCPVSWSLDDSILATGDSTNANINLYDTSENKFQQLFLPPSSSSSSSRGEEKSSFSTSIIGMNNNNNADDDDDDERPSINSRTTSTILSLDFSPVQNNLVVATFFKNKVHIYDINKYALLLELLEHTNTSNNDSITTTCCAKFSSDGKYILTSTADSPHVQIYSAVSGIILAEYALEKQGGGGWLYNISFTNTLSTIIVPSTASYIKMIQFDSKTLKKQLLLKEEEYNNDDNTDVHDLKTVFVPSVMVNEVETQKQSKKQFDCVKDESVLKTLTRDMKTYVNCVSIAPDQKLCAVGSDTKYLRIFETENLTEFCEPVDLKELALQQGSCVEGEEKYSGTEQIPFVLFSPDAKYLVASTSLQNLNLCLFQNKFPDFVFAQRKVGLLLRSSELCHGRINKCFEIFCVAYITCRFLY